MAVSMNSIYTIGAEFLTKVMRRLLFVMVTFSFGVSATDFTQHIKLSSNSRVEVIGSVNDQLGNVYVLGSVGDAGSIVQVGSLAVTTIGIREIILIKLSQAGAPQWIKRYGDAGSVVNANAIAISKQDELYITGSLEAGSFSAGALKLVGVKDMFLSKLDLNGVLIWTKGIFGVRARTTADGLAVDSKGNVLISGTFTFSGLEQPNVQLVGSTDAFLSRLDSRGNFLWTRSMAAPLTSMISLSIAVDRKDAIYIHGSFAGILSPSSLSFASQGPQTVFAAKLDIDGQARWVNSFGGNGLYPTAAAIAVDANFNVYLVGSHFVGIGGGVFSRPSITRYSADTDAYIIKLDPFGSVLWANGYGGSNARTVMFAIKLDRVGNAYVAGNLQSTICKTHC